MQISKVVADSELYLAVRPTSYPFATGPVTLMGASAERVIEEVDALRLNHNVAVAATGIRQPGIEVADIRLAHEALCVVDQAITVLAG